MSRDLVNALNSRVTPLDSVYHIGDFANRGKVRGVPGTGHNPSHWREQLNGHWTFFEGNHDKNNGLKHTIRSGRVHFAGLTFVVRHIPYYETAPPTKCHAVICGHVHNMWEEAWFNDVLHINVGVDVRGFMPIADSELFEVYEKAMRKKT